MADWVDDLVARTPKLARGLTWCITCGREQDVDSAWRIRRGWAICCGETMTIDSPAERAEYARRKAATDD